MNCKLDKETRDRLTSLAYDDWCKAFDNYKAAKSEQDDNSKDWKLFHDARLNKSKMIEAQAKRVLDEIKQYSPLTKGE